MSFTDKPHSARCSDLAAEAPGGGSAEAEARLDGASGAGPPVVTGRCAAAAGGRSSGCSWDVARQTPSARSMSPCRAQRLRPVRFGHGGVAGAFCSASRRRAGAVDRGRQWAPRGPAVRGPRGRCRKSRSAGRVRTRRPWGTRGPKAVALQKRLRLHGRGSIHRPPRRRRGERTFAAATSAVTARRVAPGSRTVRRTIPGPVAAGTWRGERPGGSGRPCRASRRRCRASTSGVR